MPTSHTPNSPAEQPHRVVRETEEARTPAQALATLKERIAAEAMGHQELEEIKRGIEGSSVIQEKREMLEAVQEALHRHRESIGVQEPDALDKKEPFAPHKKVKQWVDSLSLTPKQKQWATVVGVGALVIGGMILAKKVWNGVTAVKERVSENVKSAKGTATFLLVAILMTLGITGGVWGFQKWKKKVEQVEQIKKTIEDLEAKARGAKDAVKEELREKIDELKELADRLREGKGDKAPARESNEGKEKEKEKKKDTPTESREKLRSTIKNGVASAAIVIFDPHASEWELGQRAKIAQVQDIINAYSPGGKHGTVRMNTIWERDFAFDVADSDRENREKASQLVLRFCATRYEDVIGLLMERDSLTEEDAMKKIDAMTLQDYLKIAAASYGGVVDILQTLEDGTGNAFEKLQKLDLGKLDGIDAALQEQLRQTLEKDLHLTEEELDTFSYKEFLKAFLGGMGGTAREAVAAAPDASVETRAASQILERLRSGNTHKYMVPCFHGILPIDESLKGKSDIEKVQICLLDRMPVSQAVRCYFYGEMIKNGNPAGLALMQIEVLKFIQNSEVNVWDKMNKYDVINQIVDKAATQTPEQIMEEWKKLDVEVDDDLLAKATDLLSKTCKVLAGKAASAAGDGYLELLMGGLSTIKNNPKPSAALGTVAGVVGWRWYKGGSLPSKIYERLTALAEPVHGADWMDTIGNRLSRITLSSGNVDQAFTSYKKIYQALEKLPAGKEKDALFRALRSCNSANGAEAPWNTLIGLIKKTPALHGDVEAAATLFVKNPGMRNVVTVVRNPWVVRVGLMGRAGVKATVAKGAEVAIDTIEGLMRAIEVARNAKNNATLLKLLNNPLLKTAANAGNQTARGLLRVGAVAGKWGLRAIPFLGTLVDTVLIAQNENEIALAKQEGNIGQQQILEGKRQTLLTSGGASLGMLALSGSATVIAAPLVVGGTIYASAVYDSILTWEKGSKDYLGESPDVLLEQLADIPVNQVTIGHRAGLGDSPLYRGWKKLTWSQKEIDKEDDTKMEAVESINRNMRQEILTAYFLQTMKMHRSPSESDAQFQERITTQVRDRLQYMSRMTSGTYAAGTLGKPFFTEANSYAELMETQRTMKSRKLGTVITYDYNSTQKTLDLGPLEYIWKGGKRNEEMNFHKTLHQYQEEVQPLFEMQRELLAMNE